MCCEFESVDGGDEEGRDAERVCGREPVNPISMDPVPSPDDDAAEGDVTDEGVNEGSDDGVELERPTTGGWVSAGTGDGDADAEADDEEEDDDGESIIDISTPLLVSIG